MAAEDQALFSQAYQSLEDLVSIFPNFVFAEVLVASFKDYDCDTDALEFRPETGIIFYVQAAGILALGLWCAVLV